MLKIRSSRISNHHGLVVYSDASDRNQETEELGAALSRFIGAALKRRGDVVEVVNVPQTDLARQVHDLNLGPQEGEAKT